MIAIPLPGHTEGSYAYFFRGVLFVGDELVYSDGTLWPYSPRNSEEPSARPGNPAFLAQVAKSLPVSVVCTGHSGCTPPGRATALLDALARRESAPRQRG